MHPFRRKSSSTTPTPANFIKKEVVEARSKANNPGVLAATSSSIALSICSSPCDPSDVGGDVLESYKESKWRTAYGAARILVEAAKESSDMLPPLKAVTGALAVLITNYDVHRHQISCAIDHYPFLTANDCQRATDRRHRRKGAVTRWVSHFPRL